MQNKVRPFGVITLGLIVIVFAVGIWLATATPANAQCGSQASSCKNCHEVQGEDPVNADGSAWHPSHAFGDFCYICHAGNNQATDKDAAHTGMVSPLSDIQASCQQCHVADLEERAQVYADVLGVDLNSNSQDQNQSSSESTGAAESSGIGLMASTDLDIEDPNVIDYVQRYDSLVLGKSPVNVGNLIVGGLIAVVLLGGGAFVVYNEGWVGIDYEETDKYPKEYLEYIPAISRLSPQARQKLQKLLLDPREAEGFLSKYDGTKE